MVFAYMIIMILPVIFFMMFIIATSLMSGNEYIDTYGVVADGNQIGQYAKLALFPKSISFEQYMNILLKNSDFLFYFWNSILISVPSAFGLIVVSFFGGYGLAKFEFLGKKALFLCLILIVMIPYQLMLAPQLMVMNKINLLNTRLAVILPNVFLPFGTYLMYQFMRNVSDECLEAAKVDGAGQFMTLFHIVLPQVRAGIVSLLILNLIDTWNLVEQPLIFIQNQFKYPLSVVLSDMGGDMQNNIFTCCLVFLVPLVLMFLICKDNLLEGIQKSIIRKVGQ